MLQQINLHAVIHPNITIHWVTATKLACLLQLMVPYTSTAEHCTMSHITIKIYIVPKLQLIRNRN